MSVVIVGAGQGGFQAAWSLRMEGYDGSITLIGDEPYLPYQRPPLSKGFLLGKQELESVTLRPEKFYSDQRIELRMGECVASIDRAARKVVLASGSSVPYDSLILATGARVRRLADREALYLRGRDDAAQLKDRLDRAESVAVIGGGFIGLEVAAAARMLGKEAAVVEIQPRLMQRVVAPVVSDFFRELHETHGVRLMLGSGDVPRADLTVAGVGVIPNVELALEAGLTADNGIVVDEHLRTADQNIFAIGDCSKHAQRGRLESVQNAVDQAKCAAANIAGKTQVYAAVPWFWTDQFDAKLQMAGLSGGADRVVLRGSPPKFSVFYFRGGKLIAIDSISRPADHMMARKLLAAGVEVSAEQAADENFALASLVNR
ncbi:MAG: FAD-dependent oxidoreductase [Acidobacteriia bacterium]|nr:FAD-dependent oxidoreductase [Terriglobia bacterium]